MFETSDSQELLRFAPPAVPQAAVERFIAEHYGLRGTWRALKGEREQNFALRAGAAGAWVVKIAAATEAAGAVDFQCRALMHIATVDAALAVPRVVPSRAGNPFERIQVQQVTHLIRVLTYLEGEPVLARGPLAAGAFTEQELFGVGHVQGRIARALGGFHHPHANYPMPWDLKNGLILAEVLAPRVGSQLHAIAEPVLARLREILPRLRALRSQVIHNDANEANLLSTGTRALEICGVIDFGDLIFGSLPQDLSVSIASFNAWGPDLLEAACAIVRGYHAQWPLQREELDYVHDLVRARTLLNILLEDFQARTTGKPPADPHTPRAQYLGALERLNAMDGTAVGEALADACRAPQQTPAAPAASREGLPEARLRARRVAALGEAIFFYETPLHIVRGRGTRLYDARGQEYLDVYNNVPVVGHCNAEVLEAVARQAATLNTHTRYLHENVVLLAEQLGRTLPAALRVCFFTCTGSEANDLALQIARAVTGNAGVLAMQSAYHGNTTAVAAFSPLDNLNTPTPQWVGLLPPPDVYRGPHRQGAADLGERYSAYLDAAVAALGSRGIRPGALFVDSIFDANGALRAPPDYLRRLFARARAAGALCIADEVQSGLGRCGRMWGFEEFDVIPDIVTVGKPLGNGYPVAAVITTADFARRFQKQVGYFNTFGGNPVAAAAGLAVLRIIEREQLAGHAAAMGEVLMEGLGRLKQRFPIIGHIHGRGLFAGVELVSDPESLAPAKREAEWIIERMKDHHVLTGRSGPLGNILKIRPPLVFGRDDVERTLRTLELTLSEFEQQLP